MNKVITTLLIALMLIPVFLQVMPHGIDHALHETQEHHLAEQHKHVHHEDNYNHHAIHLDIVTFYNEYLHADLQAPERHIIEEPVVNAVQDTDIHVSAHDVSTFFRDELASIHSRAPPDLTVLQSGKAPLYLSTRRLRI